MFTGLIETTGRVDSVRTEGNYKLLTVKPDLEPFDVEIGDSVACSGTCLTVTEIRHGTISLQVSQETLTGTTFGKLKAGSILNLERSLRVGDRLGGHFVTGHVDTVGRLQEVKPIGKSLSLKVRFDREFDCLVVNKGSIAIDGVSLTVVECSSGAASVNLIPHTNMVTTLSELNRGDFINLEFDIIGKYIVKMTSGRNDGQATMALMKESGW